jgi:hypothetical protein
VFALYSQSVCLIQQLISIDAIDRGSFFATAVNRPVPQSLCVSPSAVQISKRDLKTPVPVPCVRVCFGCTSCSFDPWYRSLPIPLLPCSHLSQFLHLRMRLLSHSYGVLSPQLSHPSHTLGPRVDRSTSTPEQSSISHRLAERPYACDYQAFDLSGPL